MREAPPRNQRQDRIAAYRAEADHLLRLVQHPSMKTQISLAVRDLQEAAISVHHCDFDHVFVLQQIADCAIANAIRRLAVVDAAVRTHGRSVGVATRANDGYWAVRHRNVIG